MAETPILLAEDVNSRIRAIADINAYPGPLTAAAQAWIALGLPKPTIDELTAAAGMGNLEDIVREHLYQTTSAKDMTFLAKDAVLKILELPANFGAANDALKALGTFMSTKAFHSASFYSVANNGTVTVNTSAVNTWADASFKTYMTEDAHILLHNRIKDFYDEMLELQELTNGALLGRERLSLNGILRSHPEDIIGNKLRIVFNPIEILGVPI